MRYCKKCVNPDTRPNIHFDEEGVCFPCRFAEQKSQNAVDWAARRSELDEITRWGKEHTSSSYDCIVTVSGGKDSTRQALYARDELGLKPLLVSCVYPPEQQSERGARNLSNLIEHGFDTISLSLNPQVWKTMMRQGFLKYANWCKSTELALYAIPVHVAIAYKIPLIFLGENPAFTIGEKAGGLTGDASRMKYGNTLSGGLPEPLMTESITQQDVHFYRYPSEDDVSYANLRLVYLGYYIEDFNHFKNGEFAIANGLEIRNEPPEKIGDINGYTALDEDFVIVNQMIKYIKFGFGRVTDQAAEGIALGLMDRKTGIELVKKYDGKCDKSYIERFCQYLDISEDKFWEVVESVRGKDIWEKDGNGEWKLKVDIAQT
jgi:N-acetyl sugar amidotransferase